jgi:hypothetical protein
MRSIVASRSSGEASPIHRPSAATASRSSATASASFSLVWRTANEVIALVGAVLLEQHEDWQIGDRRYFSEASMAKLYPEHDNDPAVELTRSKAGR